MLERLETTFLGLGRVWDRIQISNCGCLVVFKHNND